MAAINLLSAQTTNANGAAKQLVGGPAIIVAYGTFGGGTVTIQVEAPDGSTWVPMNISFTANGSYLLLEVPSCNIRAVLSGSTGANVNCSILAN